MIPAMFGGQGVVILEVDLTYEAESRLGRIEEQPELDMIQQRAYIRRSLVYGRKTIRIRSKRLDESCVGLRALFWVHV